MNKKTSPIWLIIKDELQIIVKNSLTYTEILEHFGFTTSSLNTLIRRLKHDDISVSHFQPNKKRAEKLKKNAEDRIIPWKEVLTKDSPYKIGTSRKKRLAKEGLLEYKCPIKHCPMEIFQIGFIWDGKAVNLILDHINGDNSDNRLQNLRFVCAWCNSLLDTHAGKNAKKEVNRCDLCKSPIGRKSARCGSCSKKKINWPPIEVLLNAVESSTLTGIAEKYNTVANNVKKRIRKFFPNWK